MNTAVFATEIFGMLVVLIIMLANIFADRTDAPKNRAFISLCVSILATLVCDAISTYPGGGNEIVLYIVTMLDFIVPYIVFSFFLNYLYITVSNNVKISHGFFAFGTGYAVIASIVTFFMGISGNLFTIEHGVYQNGELYDFYLFSYVGLFAYIAILVLVNVKIMGIRDSVAAVLFVFIPFVFIIINLIKDDMAFSIAALALDVLVMHVLLQADREESLVERENASLVLAHQDELTGLANRLAFNEKCNSFISYENLGVLFCDINGLKYTNDNFGHKAGDELILKFSNMAKSNFDNNQIYRISGDEFVIFVSHMSKSHFISRAKEFDAKIKSDGIAVAATGFAFGKGGDALKLINDAETSMYIDKKEFYSVHPEYKRT